jgi:hypothetical protein
MAVPATPRNSPDSEGLVQAAVILIHNPRFNGNTDLQSVQIWMVSPTEEDDWR